MIQQESVGKIETIISEDGRSKIKFESLIKLLHERGTKEFSLLEEIENKMRLLIEKAEDDLKIKTREFLKEQNYSKLEKIYNLKNPLDVMIYLKSPVLNEYRKLSLQKDVINELINKGIDISKISILNFLTINGELKKFENRKTLEETLENYQDTKSIICRIDELKDYVTKDLTFTDVKILFSKSTKEKDLNARDDIFEVLTEEQQNAFLDIKILEDRILKCDYSSVINEEERNLKFQELGIEFSNDRINNR